ncbi:S9 family peptidase [Rhodohalobacter sp.]|uniref:S9 family peptidase n=1 Tax=Rhodohalobacter sp. TaxID=1974210 RepID=UPI002ACD554A|nr:DPP IV N-terminal domain-containing protein [Rhodohalobacter sp.]MDZ7756924.1 DPP IV N-terminal domain-containing protein [Rhodohalobacter sp.]
MVLNSLSLKSFLLIAGVFWLSIGCANTQPVVQESQQEDSREVVTEEDYKRAESLLGQHTNSLVYNTASNINWEDDGRITYLHTVPGGEEFMIADPSSGSLERAFNHENLAQTLSDLTGDTVDALNLPFNNFSFSDDASKIHFTTNGTQFSCDVDGTSCESSEDQNQYNRFSESLSPDGSKVAFIRDYNLWIRDLASGNETQLTFDGEENYGYATNNAGWTKRDAPVLLWSPDSKRIATFQQDSRNVKNMNLVSTAIGHTELQQWKYPLPGDEHIFMVERVVINLDGDEPELVRLDVEPDYQRSTITDHIAARDGTLLDAEWSSDSEMLAFVSVSRDHKEAHLQIADPNTGEVTSVLDERQDTFFESGINSISWRYLKDSNEFVWWSQRDNWGHLYLYDANSGSLKNQITTGNWNVREVSHIDEQNRVIYFIGSVREQGDPYFQYLYKINFDGSGLTLLTPGMANHDTSLNVDHGLLVDTYSTPDSPPVTVVRDLDGNELMELAEADISELEAHGWKAPTPFSVKARDGETDLYGLMYTPTNLDESKSYPVLNYLYPGPQSGSVGSRSFRASRSDKQAMAELGFIVVEVDAQGTPGRSKEFHDFYYGNMGDNGIPDQIAMIEQLAERHSYLDADRVGIYGHSGGGFASTRGILAYPDFYKVAVSGAGNHDNRNYTDAWGEKWQGLLRRNRKRHQL